MTSRSATAISTIIPPRQVSAPRDRHPLLRLYDRFSPQQGWSSFIILLAALMTVGLSLDDGNWVPTPGLSYILLWSAIAGLAVAKIRIHWVFIVALFPVGLAVGAAAVIWQGVSQADAETLREALPEMWSRLVVWYEAATSDGISTDLLPFTLALLAMAWVIGYTSSFFLFRANNAWVTVVMGGMAILTNLSFLPPVLNYSSKFFLFTLLAMLLIVRMSVVQSETSWRLRGIRFDMVNGWLTMHAAIWFALAVMVLAALLPLRVYVSHELASLWNTARTPITGLEEEFSRLLAGVQSRKNLPGRFFGTTLPFIGAISFGGEVVFWANTTYPSYWLSNTYTEYTPQGWKAGETTRIEVGPNTIPPPRPDWLERVSVDQTVQLDFASDSFLAGGSLDWLSHDAVVETLKPKQFTISMQSDEADAELPPDIQDLAADLREAGNALPQRFPDAYISRMLPSDIALNGIQFAPNPNDPQSAALILESVTVERKGTVTPEIVSWKFAERLQENHPYTMVSYVSLATDDDLRQASTEYSTFITDHYLQLPSSLPQRVRDKAAEITQNANNPLDKANAIAEYLRSEEFTYSQDIDAPPRDADGVDYFLFETKTGYSDYFASSMVVMLRAVGVPARLAAGYAPGEFNEEHGVRIVRDNDSHGWAQVFFPEYGWIDFEPTPQWPMHERNMTTGSGFDPSSVEGLSGVSGGEEDFLDPFDEIGIPGLGALGGANTPGGGITVADLLPVARQIGIVLAVAGVIWLLLLWLWNMGLRSLTPVERAYAKMNRLGVLAGMRRRADQTPHEYAAALSAVLGEAGAAAHRIASTFAAARYAPAHPDADRAEPDADQADAMEQDWRTIRGPLAVRALKRLLPGGNPPIPADG